MGKKGFTLIELMIVITIIGILAMIAIPGYIGQQKRAARTEAYTNLQNLRLLEEQYFADNGCYYMEGATPACTDKTLNGLSAIEAFLPGFKPGLSSTLGYSYSISVYNGASGNTAGAFKAFADGQNSRVKGDSFWVDSDNNKNF